MLWQVYTPVTIEMMVLWPMEAKDHFMWVLNTMFVEPMSKTGIVWAFVFVA